jgi:hypothetical protein
MKSISADGHRVVTTGATEQRPVPLNDRPRQPASLRARLGATRGGSSGCFG